MREGGEKLGQALVLTGGLRHPPRLAGALGDVPSRSRREERERSGQSATGRQGAGWSRSGGAPPRSAGLRSLRPSREWPPPAWGRPSGAPLPVHVDAAAEMCAPSAMATFGDDVAVDRAAVADVHLLRRGDVAGHLAEHDHRLGEDLCLDLAVGPIVSTCSLSSILPSTCPSIVRSSLPLSSPLMTTDLPMFTTSLMGARSPAPGVGRAATAEGTSTAAGGGAAGADGVVGGAGAGCRGASSRFHMLAFSRLGPQGGDDPRRAEYTQGDRSCLGRAIAVVYGRCRMVRYRGGARPHAHLSRPQRHDPVDPAVIDARGRRDARRVRQCLERAPLRPARQGRAGRGAAGRWRRSSARRSARGGLHERRDRERQPRHPRRGRGARTEGPPHLITSVSSTRPS
jgi:hypothetical protein